jgi:alcohol dehydrogenase
MKAAQINEYGGRDVVQVNDGVPKPIPGPGQILVAVQAAGVNPFDYKVREGQVRQMVELHFPATLGGDVSGTVVQIGSEVTGFEVGQAVYGQAGALSGQGSFAEFTPVKASQLAAKPVNIDFVTAAAVPLTGVSAYQALVDHLQLKSGQKILIHGGVGGIGSLAIQLAKHLGAYVATTAAAADTDFVKGLGADEVVDYKTQDFSELLHDYDAVYDTVGGETNTKSYKVLKPGSALVSMVASPDDNLVAQHQILYTHQSTQVTNARLAAVAHLIDDKVLQINVDKAFPLEQAAEALEYLKTGHPRGKVVIRVSD